MPLLLSAGIALVVGGSLGFAAVPGLPLAILLAGLATLAAWRRAGTVAIALGAILLAAHDHATSLREADARCRANATRARRWDLVLRQGIAPGGFARAQLTDPLDDACQVEVALLARSGEAPAGSRVRVLSADPVASERGVVLRAAHVVPLEPPRPLARWRNQVAASLDTRFGADGPVARALLIADTRGLDPSLRERYADAGLVHLLSISGLHVAIVGGALLLVLQAVRLPAETVRVAAVGIVAVYVMAIGAPPPAVRSMTLFAVTTLAQLRQRPVSPWGSYTLAALVPLWDLRTLLDLGWQLSVTGYAAIVVAGRVGRRIPDRWPRWGRALAREGLAGGLASCATAALVTWHFGRLSLIAPLSNLIATPVIAVLQPTLFLAMLLPDAVGNAFVVDAARPLLRLLDAIADGAAAVPAAAVDVAPSLTTAVLAGCLAAALLVAGWARHPTRWLLVAMLAGVGIVWTPDRPVGAWGALPVEVHLLDVGQGDAIAIRSSSGAWLLIDAGRRWSTGDAGRATIIPYLRRRGGPLHDVVLTHPHADHIGGAETIARALRPVQVYDAGFVLGQEGYQSLLEALASRHIPWRRARPGDRLAFDGGTVTILAPDSAWAAGRDDPNDASTVVRLEVGAIRFLFMGDAEAGEERWLLDRHGASALRATVLKVGHHGSRTSSGASFVEAVQPRVALVSVGADNGYGHPHPEVMRRLVTQGATVLRTDQLGTVVLRTDGTRLEVEAAGHRWSVAQTVPQPLPQPP